MDYAIHHFRPLPTATLQYTLFIISLQLTYRHISFPFTDVCFDETHRFIEIKKPSECIISKQKLHNL
jgi:hypothetical protein